MKYLKLFGHHVDYEGYIIQDGVLRPNVSHCVDQKCVHYNPTQGIVSATVRTSDFERIIGGSGELPTVYNAVNSIDIPTISTGCYHMNAKYYFYKVPNMTQRTDGYKVVFTNYYGVPTDDVFVTYDQSEYEDVKRKHEFTILLTQDGSLVSAAKYDSNSHTLNTFTEIPQFDENGNVMYDDQTGEVIAYTGKYDVTYAYQAMIVNGNLGAMEQTSSVYQSDGIALPDYVGVFFSEEEFLSNDSYDTAIWLDQDGTLRAVKNRNIVMDENDNYITEDVMPKFDANGFFVFDENDNMVFYNDKYVVPSVMDYLPFSDIKVNGTSIDLEALIRQNRGFYEFSAGTYTLEYVLKKKKVIPEYAFNKCTALENIRIPSKVKTIDPHAFDYCPLLDTDEATIMRICGAEPIVIEAEFDFEEGEVKVLQEGTAGIFSYPRSGDDSGGGDGPKKDSNTTATVSIPEIHYFTINNGIVADVNCYLNNSANIDWK